MSEKFTFLAQTIISLPFRLALSLFADLRVRNYGALLKLPEGKGVILAANHKSQLDSIVLPCALPLLSRFGPLHFVSLDDKHYGRFPIGKYFYGGWLFKILGAYSVAKGLRNYEAALSTHINLARRGRSVVIYPEGKVIYEAGGGEAHGGVAYLAKVTDAPIVPVSISGTFSMSWRRFFTGACRIQVTFGEPVYFSQIDRANLPEDVRYRAAAGTIMDIIGHGQLPLPRQRPVARPSPELNPKPV